MYSNCFGVDGVTKMIELLKTEVIEDGAQLGVTDLTNVSRSLINAKALEQDVFLFDD